jgi:flavin reductase (DIM6/NTAB) family NADH-FMN oxidoreductase RutF
MAGRQVGEKPLDAAAFRQVIGRFMSGVVVITATHQDERRGMTVSAIASLSLDPR